jgi:hypothetical protein
VLSEGDLGILLGPAGQTRQPECFARLGLGELSSEPSLLSSAPTDRTSTAAAACLARVGVLFFSFPRLLLGLALFGN